jgi:hypothetical protein
LLLGIDEPQPSRGPPNPESAAHPQASKRTQELLEFLKSGEAIPQDPLSTEQNAVLRALFSVIHLKKNLASIQTLHLTNSVNYFLGRANEKLRLQPRKVGAVLKSLGFSNRKRTHLGWIVSLDQSDFEKIHQLAERYGIDDMSDRVLVVSRDECGLCRAAAKRDSAVAARNPADRSMTMDMRDVFTLSVETRFFDMNVMNIVNVAKRFEGCGNRSATGHSPTSSVSRECVSANR